MDVEDNEGEERYGESFYKFTREELLREMEPGNIILLICPKGSVELKVKNIYHKGRYIKCRVIGKGKELMERRVEFEEFIKYGTIL